MVRYYQRRIIMIRIPDSEFIERIKKYVINPVEAREASPEKPECQLHKSPYL